MMPPPPEGLLEIAPGVYAFSHCFSSNVLGVTDSTVHIRAVIEQLRANDKSFMVFNFGSKRGENAMESILAEYDMSAIEYRADYTGSPILTVRMLHHFLESSKNWLSSCQKTYLLVHSEVVGWAILPFALSALLIYMEYNTDDRMTLEKMYMLAPQEHMEMFSRFNHMPSQLRYLRYISRRNDFSEWPPGNKAITLECVILRTVPNFDGQGGCRPLFRIYGPDPQMPSNSNPALLFSSPKSDVRSYKKADEPVELEINCIVQGDVALECVNVDEDDHEHVMFRLMFNTAFIELNLLMLTRDQIDILWNSKELFQAGFRAEAHFYDSEAVSDSEAHISDSEASTSIHQEILLQEKIEESLLMEDSENERETIQPTWVAHDVLSLPVAPATSPPTLPPPPPPLPPPCPPPPLSGKRSWKTPGAESSSLMSLHGDKLAQPAQVTSWAASPPPPPPPPPPFSLPRIVSSETPYPGKKSPLKALHWDKLTHPTQGSIWEELQQDVEDPETPEFDMDELTVLFRQSNVDAAEVYGTIGSNLDMGNSGIGDPELAEVGAKLAILRPSKELHDR